LLLAFCMFDTFLGLIVPRYLFLLT